MASSYTTLDDFRKLIAVVQELQAEDAFYVAIDVDGAVQTRFLKRDVSDRVAERHETTFPEVIAWSDDLDDVLTALASNANSDRFVEGRTTSRTTYPDPESETIARQKYEIVAEAFDANSLSRRSWIRRTSKFDVAPTVSWEVITRHAVASVTDPTAERIPLGLMRLSAQSPAAVYSDDNSIVLGLDADDVAYLIFNLEQLRSQLADHNG